MQKAAGHRKKLLTVRVLPGSRMTKVKRLAEGEYRVHVSSPPEKGRANKAVEVALGDYFGLPAGRVRIVRGEKSRIKWVSLEADE